MILLDVLYPEGEQNHRRRGQIASGTIGFQSAINQSVGWIDFVRIGVRSRVPLRSSDAESVTQFSMTRETRSSELGPRK